MPEGSPENGPKPRGLKPRNTLGTKCSFLPPFIKNWTPRTWPAFRKPNGPNKLFGPSRAAVTRGAVLRGIRASPRSLFPLGESGTKFDSSTLFESKLLRWDVKACTLRAVPHFAQMEYGEQNPSLNHGWVGRQTTHLNGIDRLQYKVKKRRSRNHTPKPRPKATARSVVRSRRRPHCRRRRRGCRSRQNLTLFVTCWHGAALFP